MNFLVLLTVYKRNYIEKQLECIYNQTLKPDYIIVFQNENHISIEHLKSKYNFIHIKSDYNTKFYGRFTYCINFPVDICIIMDDDIFPAKHCIENYINQCIHLNSIIGGNGRPINRNKDVLDKFNIDYEEIGIRKSKKVDFVGHMWCFKKDWLYYMFSIKPYTFDTGEDIHLCLSCKVKGNIDSYIAAHKTNDDICDTSNGIYYADDFASFKYTSNELRNNVAQYFITKFNLEPLEY
jgi:hypothetical protein